MTDNRLSTNLRADAETRLPRGIVSGFVAMFAMIVVFMIGYLIASQLAETDALGATLRGWFDALAQNEVVSLARESLYLAVAIHFMAGLVWALVYVFLFEPFLKGQGWLKGALFSLVPWALSLVVFFPIVGGGFLGLSLGAGPLPIIGNLIVHLVYGATLGAMYAILADSERKQERSERISERSGQRSAGMGVLVGGAIGAAVGVALALVISLALDRDTVLGLSPWFFALGSAFIGGAWGGLIGSIGGYNARS